MYMLVNNATHQVITFSEEPIPVFGYDAYNCIKIDDTINFSYVVIDNWDTFVARSQQHQYDELRINDYVIEATYEELQKAMQDPHGVSFDIYWNYNLNHVKLPF